MYILKLGLMEDRIIPLITYKVKEEHNMKSMNNKIILLAIILITSTHCAFAIQEGKVISDSASKKEVMDAFEDINEVNQYTNNFFTPHVTKIVKKGLKDDPSKKSFLGSNEAPTHGSILPVKKLRLRLQNRNNPKNKEIIVENVEAKDQAILDCDMMEYFAPRTELEADGNVVMFFPENNSTIKADKVIYNQTSNLIKAFGNVVLINDGKELFGDYMQIDMNEENALMDNPATDVFQIRARAKKGYMYGDKIIQEQGSLYVKNKMMINLKAEMFGPDLDAMFVDDKDKSYFAKDSHGEKFKIKTNDLIINSKKEHDTVTLKHAEVYFNERKVGTIPTITMHTNKKQDYMEADFPEIGTMMNMGMYAGPGFVFDTPKGTTLKVVPVLNYQSGGGSGSDSPLGFGSIVKFKSATNKTDMAYGTANNIFIMRGLQKLDDNLLFQYGANAYMDDFFMGFRMPKLLGELIYQDSFLNTDFLGKNKDMIFTQRATAAYIQSGSGSGPLLDGQGNVGTTRFKYMTDISQTLYKFNDSATSALNARLDLVGQGSAAVYGTGDTQMVARIGPRIHTQYKWWMQDVGYFLSAANDHTPMLTYDSYVYGRSNVYLRESFRLCKYLTASWFGSVNLSNDAYDGKMLQENGFYFSIGPDDVKLNIGYDTVREQSFITMAMHLDAKGSTVEYKKMVIKNPDTLGKSKDEDKKNQSFAPSSTLNESDESNSVERAEVIDIKEVL